MQIVLVGGANHVDDQLQLVDVVFAREQRLSAQKLGKNAAHRPHVDCGRVLLAGEEQLGGAVPPGDHVLGHEPLFGPGSSQPEVADLEVAAGVEEEVGGLEVAVKDVGGVHVLETTEELGGGWGGGEERMSGLEFWSGRWREGGWVGKWEFWRGLRECLVCWCYKVCDDGRNDHDTCQVVTVQACVAWRVVKELRWQGAMVEVA